MKTTSSHRRGLLAGWTIFTLALGLPVGLTVALEPSLPAAAPKLPAEPVQEARAVTTGSWFQQIFHGAKPDPKQAAIEQIEAIGLSVDANSCIRAVTTKNRRLIDLFLQSGFDLNSPGDRGRTALMAAALEKDWTLVADLLKAGANPNIADESGVTPLMAAAMARQPEPIQALVQAGADPAVHDESGHTALHYAVATQNIAGVTTLLKAGAPASGDDLVAQAFESRQKGLIVPILEAQTERVEWNTPARELLQAAIAAKDTEFTRLMLAKFDGAPTAEGKAQPLLAYALLENDLAKFKYLLECGADPNTPLNSPVEKSFSSQVPSAFVKLYLDNEGGMTTLMLAAGMERLDFVKALLDSGAKRNLVTAKYKMPAVVFAARSENPEAMQMLIGDCPTAAELRIEISLSAQRASLYRNGVSVFSTPISSGRAGNATPTGRFVVSDKHVHHRSTLYPADMPYFMRLSYRDFGMHQGNLPGYPASHGCIRLPMSSARQLFKEVPVGTYVSITR